MAVDVIASIIEVRDSATAPLKTIAGQATTTATALNRADTAAAAVGVTAETKLVPSFNKLASAGRVVGVQMVDVAQQLAAGQAPMMILIQQGGQVAQQFAMMGIGLGALAAPLAVVATAVGALGGAYFVLKQDLDRATAAMAESRAEVETMSKVYGQVREAALLAAVAQGKMTQAEYDTQAAVKTANDAFSVRIQTLEDERRALMEGQREQEKGLNVIERAAQAVGVLHVIERDYADELAANARKLEIARAGADRYAKDLNVVAGSTAKVAKETEIAFKAVDLFAALLAELSAEFDAGFAPVVNSAIGVLTDFYAAIDGSKSLEDLKMAEIDLDVAFSRGLVTLEQYTAALEALQSAAAEVKPGMLPDLTESMMSDSFASTVSGDVPGMAVNAMGALGYAGGGPVGVALGGLEALGETGAQATLDDMASQLTNIAKGMEELPDLLANLPALFLEHLPELVAAQYQMMLRLFFTLPFEMAAAVIEKFDAWWSGIGGLRGLATSVADGLRDWWQDAWAALKTWFSELFDLSDLGEGAKRAVQAAGSYVMTGSTERSSAGRGASSGRGSGFGSGTTVNVNMTTAALHPEFAVAIERDLKRVFGTTGLRSSPLFGGG